MTQSIKMLPAPRYLVKRSPASIIKAYENDMPKSRLAAIESQSRTSKSAKNPKYRQHKEPPFAAKVKRRWSDTKSKVRRRLGMYAFMEPLPLGMYMDMLV